jgi:hypothetical protein
MSTSSCMSCSLTSSSPRRSSSSMAPPRRPQAATCGTLHDLRNVNHASMASRETPISTSRQKPSSAPVHAGIGITRASSRDTNSLVSGPGATGPAGGCLRARRQRKRGEAGRVASSPRAEVREPGELDLDQQLDGWRAGSDGLAPIPTSPGPRSIGGARAHLHARRLRTLSAGQQAHVSDLELTCSRRGARPVAGAVDIIGSVPAMRLA